MCEVLLGASFLWMIGFRGLRARPTSYSCVVQLVCPAVFLSFSPIFFTVVSERFAIDLSWALSSFNWNRRQSRFVGRRRRTNASRFEPVCFVFLRLLKKAEILCFLFCPPKHESLSCRFWCRNISSLHTQKQQGGSCTKKERRNNRSAFNSGLRP